MTVETQTSVAIAYGNGSTTVFPFPFYVIEAGDLVVSYFNTTTLALIRVVTESEYTVTGLGSQEGGSVTITSGAPTTGVKIERIVPYTQDLSLSNEAGFFPDTLEQQLDYLEMQIQQVKSSIGVVGPVTGVVTGVAENIYVSDALATAALSAAFPTLCFLSGTTYVRLAADTRGFIYLTQMGSVPLTGLGNAQPFIQMMYDYGRAIGCVNFGANMSANDLWCPLRTSSVTDFTAVAFALDGQQIVIQASTYTEGLPNKSVWNFKGHTGGPLATDFQIVGGVLWRGSLINIMGGTSVAPTINNIDFFSMKNMKIDGGTTWDGTGPSTPSTVTHPAGQDLTNKGIRCQNTQILRVWMEDVEVCRTQGEVYYMAGGPIDTSPGAPVYQTPTLPQVLNRVSLHDSSQSCFNPSIGGFDCTDCSFGNSSGAYEILGGTGGKLENCTFYNFTQASATGGPANGLVYNYAYPTRVTGAPPPWLDFIDCTWVGQPTGVGGNILTQNYVRLTGKCTDCFGTSSALPNGALVSTYIDLDMIYDQVSVSGAWSFSGPPHPTTTTASCTIAPPNSGSYAGSTMTVPISLTILNQFSYGCGVYMSDGTNTVSGVVNTAFGTIPAPTVMSVFVENVNGSTSPFTGTLTLASGASVTATIPGSTGNVPILAPVDIKAKLRVRRTPVAKAANMVTTAFLLNGIFDQHTCTFILDEGDGIAGITSAGSAGALVIGSLPLIQVNCPTNSDTLGTTNPNGQTVQLAASGAIALAVTSPVMSLGNQGSAATIPVTMTAPFTAPYGYAHGQKITIEWSNFYNTVGTVYTMAQYTPGVALRANRKWWGDGDKLFLKWDSQITVGATVGAWVEEEYVSATYNLFGTGSITPASLATGAMAALGTVTVTNATVGDLIESVRPAAASGGVNFWGEVTAANTVTVYARNDKGSAYNPGATVFTVEGHKV